MYYNNIITREFFHYIEDFHQLQFSWKTRLEKFK